MTNNDDATIRVRARGNRGCVWLAVTWTCLVAFSCAAWLAAQAWEAWN